MPNHVNDLEKFVKLSKFAGERFDLIQAGGGNTSVKLTDSKMIVKASGYALSDVDQKNGYATVNHAILENYLSNLKSPNEISLGADDFSDLVSKATSEDSLRPSIETLMHCVMGKFVLHAHPLVVSMSVCSRAWKDQLKKMFPDSVLVPYQTPGVGLALGLIRAISASSHDPRKEPMVVFLQNHGIIVSASDYNQVVAVVEGVVQRLADYFGFDDSMYRSVSSISALVNETCGTYHIAYLSEDVVLNNALRYERHLMCAQPFTPDMVVYNGVPTLILNELTDYDAIGKYHVAHKTYPRLILCRNRVYLIAASVRKAQALESVLKFQILTMRKMKGETNYLSDRETNYLSNWEAEKFRSEL